MKQKTIEKSNVQTAKELKQTNEQLLNIVEDIAVKKQAIHPFLLYIELVSLIDERELVYKRQKNNDLSKKYIDVIYSNFQAILTELIPDETEQKSFEKFIKMFELVSFNSGTSTLMLMSEGKQVKGCRIDIKKYKTILELLDNKEVA